MRPIRTERGAVLVMALVFLLILTLLGVTAMRMSSLETVMAGNTQEITKAFEAAESGLTKAYNDPSTLNLFTAQTKNYSFDDGKGGNATVVTEFIQFAPPKRGSGYSASQYDASNFNQASTAATLTGARSVVNQGTALIVPKSN
jgi:type IV pilus assembly protein PilX